MSSKSNLLLTTSAAKKTGAILHPGVAIRTKYGERLLKEVFSNERKVQKFLSGKRLADVAIANLIAEFLSLSPEAVLYESERFALFRLSKIKAKPIPDLKRFSSRYSSLQDYLTAKLLEERGETILSLHVQLQMERGNVKRFVSGKGSVHLKTVVKILQSFNELDPSELLTAKVQGEFLKAS